MKPNSHGNLIANDTSTGNPARLANDVLKWVGGLFLVLVLVAAGEFGQYMKSAQDVRHDTIARWIADNPSQKQLAEKFVDKCLEGGGIQNKSIDAKVVSVYDCGKGIGANDLVDAVKRADSTLVSVSWPLSLAAY